MDEEICWLNDFFMFQTFSFGGQTLRSFWQRKKKPVTGDRHFQTAVLPNFCQTSCSILMGGRTRTDSCLKPSSFVVSRPPKLRYNFLQLLLSTNNNYSPKIQSLKLGTVTYRQQDDVATYGPAHKSVENIIKGANLSTYSFSNTERVRSHAE